MFERFTDRARRTLVLAQEASESLGHNFIGTEHLLLGLALEGEGVAAVSLSALAVDARAVRDEVQARVPSEWSRPGVADALATVGIDLEAVRREVENTFGVGALRLDNRPPFTPKAMGVLEASLSEAIALGHNFIGTEHLLLGVTSLADGLAIDILVALGTTPAAVRSMVLAVLTSASQWRTSP